MTRQWKAFTDWRKAALANPTRSETCACISSKLNPTWASKVHKILFHVCKGHGNEFGIHDGPYWKHTVLEMENP